jgi:hypothetical protein
LKITLKGHHFDTIEVMETESQAALNRQTQHDVQVAFKTSRKLWNRCIYADGDYFETYGGQMEPSESEITDNRAEPIFLKEGWSKLLDKR